MLRGREGASRLLLPCPHEERRKMPRNTGTLDRSAQLCAEFRGTTLSPSGRDSEPFLDSMGRNHIRSH